MTADIDLTKTHEALLVAKDLRAHLIAIAHDSALGLIPMCTSPSTGVAGRIRDLIEDLDRRTHNRLAT